MIVNAALRSQYSVQFPTRMTNRLNSVFATLDVQVGALLKVHSARNLAEFWETSCQVISSTLGQGFCWFDSSPFVFLDEANFAHNRGLKSYADFRRFCDLHPVRLFLKSNPEIPVARLSDLIPSRQLRKLPFYRDFMAANEDTYAVVLAVGNGNRGNFLGFHRSKKERDFSPVEMRWLKDFQRELTVALKRARSLESERQIAHSLADVFYQLPLPLLVLDWDLNPLYVNSAGKEMAGYWMSGVRRSRFMKVGGDLQIPTYIQSRCEALKANLTHSNRLAGLRRDCRGTTINSHDVPGVCVTIRVAGHHRTPCGSPAFLIMFEGSSANPSSGPTCRHLSQLNVLSRREREVALLASQGSSDKEIASRLGKSVLTVKKQLGSIYHKLDIPNRSRLGALFRQSEQHEVFVEEPQRKRRTKSDELRRFGRSCFSAASSPALSLGFSKSP